MDYRKIDDNTLEVDVVVPEVITPVQYTRQELEDKKTFLQAQKADYSAQRDSEIAEVDALLAKCDELEIILPE